MKFKYSFAIGLILAGSGAEAADFSHCQKFLKGRFITKVEMGDDGKLSVKESALNGYSYTFANGTLTLSKSSVVNEGDLSKTEFKTKDGRLLEMKYTYADAPQSMQKEVNTVTFREKNGVCYPSAETEEKTWPISRGTGKAVPHTEKNLVWDTQMCKELTDFLAKAPESLLCRCGNDSTNKKLSSILKKYDPAYKLPSGQPFDLGKELLTDTENKATKELLEKLSNPLSHSTRYVENCRKSKVLAAATDRAIWKDAAVSVPAGNDETGAGSVVPAE